MTSRLASILAILLAACGTGEVTASAPDARVAGPDASAFDAGEQLPAGPDAGPGLDAGTSSNAPCSFNSDCVAAERCECDEATGCFCRIGTRGTGKSGVDRCTDGNDCESSVCSEGPSDVYYCSGQCETDDDCGPMLPICADIAYVGRICKRIPPS